MVNTIEIITFAKYIVSINEIDVIIMEHNYDLSKAQYNKNNKICVICHKKDKNGVEHGEYMIEEQWYMKKYL